MNKREKMEQAKSLLRNNKGDVVTADEVYKSLMNRRDLFGKMNSVMGTSHNGERNLYNVLGYPEQINLQDYVDRFKRQDIAKGIILKPVRATWNGGVKIKETEIEGDTPLEKEWDSLSRKLKLISNFMKLDALTGLGHYAVLLVGFDDVEDLVDFKEPVKEGKREILYVKPYPELYAKIVEWESDPSSPRFNLPTQYEIQTQLRSQKTTDTTVMVHHSRVLHVTDFSLFSETEGEPRLQGVYNRLMDLDKIIGGSAEMFWRGARPGFTGKVGEDFEWEDDDREKLQTQFDEYEHGLRRFLVAQGIEIESLGQQISDPTNHVSVQMDMIATDTNIPKRILTGTERGELASSEDRTQWLDLIVERRDIVAEPSILVPFLEMCLHYDILSVPVSTYEFRWKEIYAQTDKEIAQLGKIRAEALQLYSREPLAQEIIPEDVFYRIMLGLDNTEIKFIKEYQEGGIEDESKEVKESEEIDESEEKLEVSDDETTV